jgi:hypothetical protein
MVVYKDSHDRREPNDEQRMERDHSFNLDLSQCIIMDDDRFQSARYISQLLPGVRLDVVAADGRHILVGRLYKYHNLVRQSLGLYRALSPNNHPYHRHARCYYYYYFFLCMAEITREVDDICLFRDGHGFEIRHVLGNDLYRDDRLRVADEQYRGRAVPIQPDPDCGVSDHRQKPHGGVLHDTDAELRGVGGADHAGPAQQRPRLPSFCNDHHQPPSRVWFPG